MHVFDADGAAIRIAKNTEQFIECHLLATGDSASEELALEVPDGESVGCEVEFARKTWGLPMQWVDVCNEVATHAVHTHQHAHLHLLFHHCLFAIHWRSV